MLVTKGAGNVNKIIQGESGFIYLVIPSLQHRPSLSMTYLTQNEASSAGGFNYFLIKATLDSFRNLFFAS